MGTAHDETTPQDPRGLRCLPRPYPSRAASRNAHAVVTGEPDDRETVMSGSAGGRAEKEPTGDLAARAPPPPGSPPSAAPVAAPRAAARASMPPSPWPPPSSPSVPSAGPPGTATAGTPDQDHHASADLLAGVLSARGRARAVGVAKGCRRWEENPAHVLSATVPVPPSARAQRTSMDAARRPAPASRPPRWRLVSALLTLMLLM